MGYLSKENWVKLKNKSKRYSGGALFYKVLEKLHSPYRDYPLNYQKYLPDTAELERQAKTKFEKMPKVSIVVPTYETDKEFLCQMIDSVINQTYSIWELCIADGSESNCVSRVIQQAYAGEKRIKYKKLERNQGISENTNQGFQMAEGEYVALLDHDDLLVPSALYEMVKCVNETEADLLYSDEDMVSGDLKEYMNPHFKLDFNRELLLGNNYICHFLMVSRQLLNHVGGLDSQYDGAQDHEFVLRCSRRANRIEHIPKILYHWRVHQASTAGNTDSKLYAYEAGKRAVEDFIAKENWCGSVTMNRDLGFYRVNYQVPEKLNIGIILWGNPSRKWEKVKAGLEEELSEMKAKVCWDYGWEQPADYVLIINRNAVRIKKNSLQRLVASCHRPGIGIVGGKILSRGKVVQCGYWKHDGAYLSRFAGLPEHFKGYFHRAELAVETDATTHELAVIKRNALMAEEEAMLHAGHDVFSEEPRLWQRFCERIKENGYRIITDPVAELKRETVANFRI